MNTKRIQDAEKLVKKGEEHLKTGLFKWSPDIDSAIECFDKGEFFIEFQNFRLENFFLIVLVFQIIGFVLDEFRSMYLHS